MAADCGKPELASLIDTIRRIGGTSWFATDKFDSLGVVGTVDACSYFELLHSLESV